MGPGSRDKKKKTYLSPTLTKLTLEQAKKLVAARTGRSDQEATEFLQSLHQQQPQKEEKHPLNDARGKKRQRSA